MSSIDAVGDSTYPQEVTTEDVYGWHYDKASEYFSSIRENNNPFYLIPSAMHLFGAMLTKFPGVGQVICAVSKSSLPPGMNYTIALNHKNYRRALDLAREGADLSICNTEGKNLVELLFGYDDQMFKEAFKLALKRDPSFMVNDKETAVDFLLTNIPNSVRFVPLLVKAIIEGGTFNPAHPESESLFFLSILTKEFELTAILIEKGVIIDTRVGHECVRKAFPRLSKLPPPFDLDVLEPYATDLTEKALNGEFEHLKTREVCLKRLLQIFLKKEKNHPLT